MNAEQSDDRDITEKARILVVDDVPKNIQVLGSLLRSEGYQVIPATSGAQALKAAETHKPDLILLDVMMPEMSGYEVIQKLHADPSMYDTPVIFITALTDDEDEAKGLGLGAVDYITKPINIPITLARVKTHLNLRFARKKLEEQNEQLIEAAQLREDVERMSRHDLKNPLQTVIGSPPLIVMLGDNLNPQQIDLLGRVKNAGYRMLEMINRSLDLYKMETGVYPYKPESVDLVGIIDRIIEETQSVAASKKISMEICINDKPLEEKDVFEVMGEELLCYSMLANLVKNALEASPEGKKIEVSFMNGEPGIIRVHNKGAVPESIRDQFFEKYATSGKERGTGLGTYTAKLITETQGGTIGMESNEEDGTTITITMP